MAGIRSLGVWYARARYKNSTMLPSCGCSQSSLIVGMAPIFKRSMWVASVSWRAHVSLFVIAEQTKVGPIDSSILSCGHSTTVLNGNMYSFLAMALLGDLQCTIVGRK